MRVAVLGALTGAALMAFGAAATAQTPVDDLIAAWAASPHAMIEAEAFTHWDEEGEVAAACATCHSGTGFRDFIGADGTAAGTIDEAHATRTLIDCATCHNDAANMLASVSFPSGATVDGLDGSARCMVCHQGREAGANVDEAAAGTDDDAVNGELGFLNIHYRAAAATLYGTEVKGGYEYAGLTYSGKAPHAPGFDSCIGCHSPHSTEVKVDACATCHQGAALGDIRFTQADADGDGNTTEGIQAEVMHLHEMLLAEIQAYASGSADAPIAYNEHAYPYFFADTNGDGTAGDDESVFPNRYQSWTPRLLRAAYNYQFVAKDPGAYAHNPHYALQILHDSIADLAGVTGTDVTALVRP